MIRRYGRCPSHTRLVDKTPHGHWKTTTFVATWRHDGLTAPLVIDGAINGEVFLAYVRQHLVPSLRVDDIVVMDNLSVRKVAGVREVITAVRARVLYLPPHLPDLNPIERVFAKLWGLLQSAGERTIDALWQRIGTCVDALTPDECANHLRHCGYR